MSKNTNDLHTSKNSMQYSVIVCYCIIILRYIESCIDLLQYVFTHIALYASYAVEWNGYTYVWATRYLIHPFDRWSTQPQMSALGMSIYLCVIKKRERNPPLVEPVAKLTWFNGA